jgi:hypothetical protein
VAPSISAGTYAYLPSGNITLNPSTTTPLSYTVTFTVTDDNGDNDVTSLTGAFYYNTTLSSGLCNPTNELECYDTTGTSSCSIPGGLSGSSGSFTGTCHFELWFNASPASTWNVHVNPADETGTVTDASESADRTINSLLAIDISESTINYGSLAPGTVNTTGQETTMANLGNVEFDILIDGTDMTGAGTIDVSQQQWHHTSSAFDWDNPNPEQGGGWTLINNAATGGDAAGCANRNVEVRTDHSDGTGKDEKLYWKMKIPQGTPIGGYSGTNTFQPTDSGDCTGYLDGLNL